MNDPAFKTAAFNMAENTPEYLGKPTTPPIRWRQEDDILIVILADGRKVRGPIFDRYRDKIASKKKQVEALKASLPAIVVVPVPVREVVAPFPVREMVAPFPVREVFVPVPSNKPKTSSPSGKKKK